MKMFKSHSEGMHKVNLNIDFSIGLDIWNPSEIFRSKQSKYKYSLKKNADLKIMLRDFKKKLSMKRNSKHIHCQICVDPEIKTIFFRYLSFHPIILYVQKLLNKLMIKIKILILSSPFIYYTLHVFKVKI